EDGCGRVECVCDQCGFVLVGCPRFGAERIETEPGRGVQQTVPRVVSKEERANAAGRLERVMMQPRQQIARSCRLREQRHQLLSGPERVGRRGRNRTGGPCLVDSGHQVASARGDPGFYFVWPHRRNINICKWLAYYKV